MAHLNSLTIQSAAMGIRGLALLLVAAGLLSWQALQISETTGSQSGHQLHAFYPWAIPATSLPADDTSQRTVPVAICSMQKRFVQRAVSAIPVRESRRDKSLHAPYSAEDVETPLQTLRQTRAPPRGV